MTATGQTTDALDRLARAGLIAKGFLYGTIGVLSLLLVFTGGGSTSGQQGALRQLAQEGTWGTVVLALLAFGLAAYGLWRLSQAWFDQSTEEGAKGVAVRASFVIRGLIYLAFAVLAVQILTSSGGGGGGNTQTTATQAVLQWGLPGQLLIGAVGLVLVGVGGYQAYKGVAKKFMEQLNTGAMNRSERQTVERAGLIGHLARGVIFVIIGVFVVIAAVQSDPNETVGLGGALAELRDTAFGPWLLVLVAAGFVAYAVFCVIQARYADVQHLD